jgi:argininosuccinate lyase
VGRAVRKGSLSLAILEAAAQELGPGISLKKKGLTQQKIDEVLDVNYSVSLRNGPGGPAPVATKRAIKDCNKKLKTDSALTDKRLALLANAREKLIDDARRMVA